MQSKEVKDLSLSPRILLGPGPSMIPARVLKAMATPPIGYLDPEYVHVMGEVKELLKYTFQTENKVTLPISGTGSAGMEAALCNLIEPGDPVLIAVNGFFGERMAEIAGRYGAKVKRLERPWGQIFNSGEIEAALQEDRYKLLGIVHGETSTGTLTTDVKEIASIAHQNGALLVLDTVATLGGIEVDVDGWGVDVCYSGSQKCLSAPPGLAPITLSPRAWASIQNRSYPVANWYLDLTGIWQYWGDNPSYHHTGPANAVFALREALRLVVEEGLENRIASHRDNAELLWAGLETMGLPPSIAREHRMHSLTTPQLPPDIDETRIRQQLLDEYNVEIAGGFGSLAGKIWRIGLMGHSSREEHVILLLALLKEFMRT